MRTVPSALLPSLMFVCMSSCALIPQQISIEPAIVWNTNPTRDDAGHDGRLGIGLDVGMVSDPDASIGYIAALSGLTFGDPDETDVLEAQVVAAFPLVLYTVERLVRPWDAQTSGLWPKTRQSALADVLGLYEYTFLEQRFDDAVMSALDFEAHEHVAKFHTSDNLILLDQGIDMGVEYHWARVEYPGSSVKGRSFLFEFRKSFGGAEGGARPSGPMRIGAPWKNVFKSTLRCPGVDVVVGARRLFEFEGIPADTEADAPMFLGLASASFAMGRVTLGVLAQTGAEPSHVSNYQTVTRATAGVTVTVGEDALVSFVLHSEFADRSMGPDVGMTQLTAGLEKPLGESWMLTAELHHQLRDADPPETEYEVTSFSLGVGWRR